MTPIVCWVLLTCLTLARCVQHPYGVEVLEGPLVGRRACYYHCLFSREALQTEILLQELLPGRSCSVVLTADNFSTVGRKHQQSVLMAAADQTTL